MELQILTGSDQDLQAKLNNTSQIHVMKPDSGFLYTYNKYGGYQKVSLGDQKDFCRQITVIWLIQTALQIFLMLMVMNYSGFEAWFTNSDGQRTTLWYIILPAPFTVLLFNLWFPRYRVTWFSFYNLVLPFFSSAVISTPESLDPIVFLFIKEYYIMQYVWICILLGILVYVRCEQISLNSFCAVPYSVSLVGVTIIIIELCWKQLFSYSQHLFILFETIILTIYYMYSIKAIYNKYSLKPKDDSMRGSLVQSIRMLLPCI